MGKKQACMLSPPQSVSQSIDNLKPLILLDSPLHMFIRTLSLKTTTKSVLSYRVRPQGKVVGPQSFIEAEVFRVDGVESDQTQNSALSLMSLAFRDTCLLTRTACGRPH